MKCCICGNEIEKQYHPKTGEIFWDKGNNAQPIMEGQCCGKCNDTKVIPARLNNMR